MKFNHKKLIIVMLTIAFGVNIAFSGPRNKFGTSAAPELLIPLGSIGTSLSGSNVSSISGMDAIFWNPAGFASLSSPKAEILVSHMVYFGDMSMQYFGAGASLGNLGNIGVTIRSLNIGEIMETTEIQPDGTGAIFKPTYIVANLTYAKQMTDKIRFGTNVKLINENVASVTATGFGLDFGLQYKGGNTGLAFGITIKNLGPSMKFDGPGLDKTVINENGVQTTQRVNLQDYDLPTSLELGVSYTKPFAKNMNIGLAASFLNSGFSSDEYRFGLEYSYNNILYLRGGVAIAPQKQTNESLFGPSFGVGLKYPVGGVNLGFDYAYRIVTDKAIGTNQFFTLSVGF